MKNLYLTLENWINNSIKSPVVIGNDEYSFNTLEKFSNEDLQKFEIENGLSLPSQYKDFLLKFGSVELFLSDYSAGIEIMSPYNVKTFSEEIFNNYGENPYPNLFIPVNIPATGWFGGFDLTQSGDNNFAIFFPEIDPDSWLAEADFITFNDWLSKVITSNGEEFS
ncbi:SMI1/KNR4 family protein [Aggregatibacter actinomycetemcomitans]|nr:SMI1/KNR4 family protein [Aggregatibacter actinomycetemcomitans]